MNRSLSNLLIFFAFALCGLCTFQWVRETRLRGEIVTLHDTVLENSKTIQSLEGSLKRTESEVARLEELRSELLQVAKTNRQETLHLGVKADQLGKEVEAHKEQIGVYKSAVERANASIKQQNADTTRQNEELKQLAEERNASVVKFNKLIEQYNDLVKEYKKLQEEAAKAAKVAAAPSK